MGQKPRIGLSLTGGGARGAYQAGALCALAEIAKEQGLDQPFSVISGTSAGSINAAALASSGPDMIQTCHKLRDVWTGLSTEKIFKVDLFSTVQTGLRWILELISGGLIPKKETIALLDTEPLRELLRREINWEQIPKNISSNFIHMLAITAVNYADGGSKTFYQSNYPYEPWKRTRRDAQPDTIAIEHIMASTAIPFLFPPAQINGQFFGDGSLRNHTPLSPAIKGGTDRLIVIGVRRESPDPKEPEVARPSQGRIFSVLLNSLFLDALDLDLERLQRINETLKYVPATAPTALRPIPTHVIRPTEDIGMIAVEEAHHMPRMTRYLLKGLGTPEETAGVISYLLFESPYTSRLAALGYKDTLAQRDELCSFFS